VVKEESGIEGGGERIKMERNPIMPYAAAKVEPEASLNEMVKEVMRLVQKDGALTKKQAWLPLWLDNVVTCEEAWNGEFGVRVIVFAHRG
jgi:hypothetical protein